MIAPEMPSEPVPPQSTERIAVKATPTNPDGVKPVYANHFVVQASDDEFFITAALATPPPITDFDELRKLQSVETPIVARIIMPPAVVPRLIEALQLTMQRFEVSLPNSSDEDGES